MMYAKIIFVFLALMLASCGSISKLFVQREQVQHSKSLLITEKVNEQLDQTEVITLVDTANMAYYIEITPIGEFSLSAATGFKGKAGTVKWKGNANKKQEVVSTTQITQKKQLTKNQNVTERNKESVINKKKVVGNVQIVWWLLLGVGIFVLIFLFRIKI